MAATSFEQCLQNPTTITCDNESALFEEAKKVVLGYMKTPSSSHTVFVCPSTKARVTILFHESHFLGLSNIDTPRQFETQSLGFAKGDSLRRFMIFSNQERATQIANMIIFGVFIKNMQDHTLMDSFPFHFQTEESLPKILVRDRSF